VRHTFLMLAFLLGGLPGVTYAQDLPAFDVSGSYSFLRDQEVEENFHGWLASITGNVNRWLGITGEFGGNYKTLDVSGSDVRVSVHSFLGGPRFVGRANPKITPFAQILLGAARASESHADEDELDDSTTEFALQPGGGVDVWLRPNVGLRVGGDYRRIFTEDEGTNEFRFHVGIVFTGRSR
jgi:hypothetical protein